MMNKEKFYAKERFAQELLIKISEGKSHLEIARWAYAIYLDFSMENNLSQALMSLIAMEEGPEFFYTLEELAELARSLLNENG